MDNGLRGEKAKRNIIIGLKIEPSFNLSVGYQSSSKGPEYDYTF